MLEEFEHLCNGDLVGWTGKKVAAIVSAAGKDKAAAFQLGEDQLCKSSRNGLCGGYLLSRDGLGKITAGQLKDGSQGIPAFFRDRSQHFGADYLSGQIISVDQSE